MGISRGKNNNVVIKSFISEQPCPICRQNSKLSKTENNSIPSVSVTRELLSLRQQHASLLEQHGTLRAEHAALSAELSGCRGDLDDLKDQLDKLEKERDALKEEKNRLDSERKLDAREKEYLKSLVVRCSYLIYGTQI